MAFFDVGGTLIAAHPSVGAVYADIAKKHGVSMDAALLQERFKIAFADRDALKTATKEGWRGIVASVLGKDAFSNFDQVFEDLFAAFRDPSRWSIFPDVIPTLEQLKTRGIRLAVASNWDDRLPGLLTDLGLRPYFEKLFISYDVTFAKPDPRFFRFALEQMKIDPLEAFHVGDHQREDIEGAQSVGMRAYLINRSKKPLNSRELVSLTEITSRI